MKKPLISIIMGSDSDLSVVQEAAKQLDDLGIDFEINIISAHRCPKTIHDFIPSLKKKGIKVIIAAAGGAAHLAGVASSLTTLPVIGIPMKSKNLDGLDALLSTVQMPPGVPVATVGINASQNAAILAAQIIALNNIQVNKKLDGYKKSLEKKVCDKNQKLHDLGISEYLTGMK
jgi:5-(carboxyamino)imidazole ribonucleotide mutase